MYYQRTTFRDRLGELWENHSLIIIASAVMALLIFAGAARQWAQPVTSKPATEQPIIILATAAAPTPVSTPQNALPRAVVAYSAPDGQVLGAIEPGRVCALVARS